MENPAHTHLSTRKIPGAPNNPALGSAFPSADLRHCEGTGEAQPMEIPLCEVEGQASGLSTPQVLAEHHLLLTARVWGVCLAEPCTRSACYSSIFNQICS